ncbi:MAG: hypothetical protein MOGMAGMI_01533 [Candidatus Omnitrophica bacterium]|nr:hypothetical protein [Candidatus Omnitrophota bacterium]
MPVRLPIMICALTLLVSGSSADAKETTAAGPAADRLLTPRERVEKNLRKEALRGRWDRDARIPAEASVEYSRDRVAEVLRHLQEDPATADIVARLKVVSKGRTVTLSGRVLRAEDAQALERSVRSLEGIDTVVNDLRVVSSPRELSV